MINGMILILILLISSSSRVMRSSGVLLVVYIYLDLFALPDHHHMLVTSMVVSCGDLQYRECAGGHVGCSRRFSAGGHIGRGRPALKGLVVEDHVVVGRCCLNGMTISLD